MYFSVIASKPYGKADYESCLSWIDSLTPNHMPPDAAHQNNWETSEVVFGIPLLISIVLGIIWPMAIVHGLLRWLLLAVGVAILFIGIGLVIATRREFARHGQPTDPGRPTSRIVTSGIFSISRNPLYLGVVIFIAGLALVLNSWWIIVWLVIEIVLCHVILIFPEERYLAAKFGEEYQSYRRAVHRWVGRK